MVERGIDVYSSIDTFKALGIKHHRAKAIISKQKFSVGNFTVLPFEVQHDAINPMGFLINHKEFGNLLFATDTFYIKYKFSNIDYMMIECNYSRKILDVNFENGKINAKVRNRVIKSHFSLENVIEFLKANDLSRLKAVYLLHLSDLNSDKELFIKEISKIVGVPVYAA